MDKRVAFLIPLPTNTEGRDVFFSGRMALPSNLDKAGKNIFKESEQNGNDEVECFIFKLKISLGVFCDEKQMQKLSLCLNITL